MSQQHRLVLLALGLTLFAGLVGATITSVTLNSPASGSLTGDSTPDFNFNATSDTNTTFSCTVAVDGVAHGTNGATANNTATVITANATLADGARSWYVNCTDVSGTVQSGAFTLTVDTTKPSVTSPVTSPATLKSSDAIQVNVTVTDANRDNSSVKVNGVAMGLVSGDLFKADTTGTALGCTAEGSCTLTFNATDLVGNVNGTTTTNVTIDNVPNVTLSSPANAAATNQTTNSFVYVPNNAQAVTSCSLIVDGAVAAVQNDPPTPIAENANNTFSSIALGEAVHSWFVNCTDSVGTGSSVTRTLTIDATAPSSVTLNSPANATNVTSSNVTFDWTAVDTVDTSMSCDILLDGVVKWSNVTSANNTATSSTRNLTADNVTLGSHSWSVKCKDDASNSNTSASRTFTFDPDPTTMSITSPTAGSPSTKTIGDDVTVTFKYTEGRPVNATVELLDSTGAVAKTTDVTSSLSGGTDVSKSVSISTSGLSAGTYDVRVTFRALNSTGDVVSVTDTEADALILQSSSSSSSGSGSGGGAGTSTQSGGAAANIDSQTHTWDMLLPNTPSTVSFIADTPVDQIIMTSNQNLTDPKITVSKVSSTTLPPPSSKVYKYVEISTQNFPTGSVKEAKIRFIVPTSWLTGNSVDEADIRMGRYSGGAWIELTTNKVSSSSVEVSYQATTTGFSTFAIYAEEAPAANATTNATGNASCTDQCVEGFTRCADGAVETCGNFDDDTCLEWGNATACEEGLVCQDGSCQAPGNETGQRNLTATGDGLQPPAIDPIWLAGGAAIALVAYLLIRSRRNRGPRTYTPRRIISKGI